VAGGVLDTLVRRTLWSEFDEALAARARSLASLVEQDEDGLECELLESPFPEFAVGDHPAFYLIRLPDGSVFARSPSLEGQDLEAPVGASNGPVFRTTRLPNGEPGRLVGMRFVPRRDGDALQTDPPAVLTLVVGRETASLRTTLARLRALLVGVCLGAVSSSAGLLAWIVRKRLRPVARLSEQIAALDANDLSVRVSGQGMPRELAPVVDCLNDLLGRLDAAFRRERRFTGDVAHELRTPLAGLRAKLEVALSRERTGDTYRTTLRDCLEIDLRMQGTVENLLQLARADAGQLEFHRQHVDIRSLVHTCWQRLDERARARGVQIDWQLTEPGVVETDRDALQLVIQNILDNAVAYVDDGGWVGVSVSAANGAVELAVCNSGCRLSPEDVPRVFDRFWRADPSFRTGEDGHCGIGLPLCRALTDRLGGRIDASASAEGVFTLTLRLPGG
jgi:two-component system sensor histidine kinase QseC